MSDMPTWANSLFQRIAESVQFKGPAELEAHYYEPEETSWGCDLLEISPRAIELFGGVNDGAQVEGIFHEIDFCAMKGLLQRVDGFTFGFEEDGRGCFTLEGMVELYSKIGAGMICDQHEIVICIYTGARP
jgi:hypothetical protein